MRGAKAISGLLCVSVAFAVALQSKMPAIIERKATGHTNLSMLSQRDIEGLTFQKSQAEASSADATASCAAVRLLLGRRLSKRDL